LTSHIYYLQRGVNNSKTFMTKCHKYFYKKKNIDEQPQLELIAGWTGNEIKDFAFKQYKQTYLTFQVNSGVASPYDGHPATGWTTSR